MSVYGHDGLLERLTSCDSSSDDQQDRDCAAATEEIRRLIAKLQTKGNEYQCMGCQSTFSTPGHAKLCPVCSCSTFA